LICNRSPIGNLKRATFVKLSLVKSEQFVITRISQTESPTTEPLEPWFIMTNLPKSWQLELGGRYSLRGWIEYGFKQVKNELGWADFRVTDYASIERWWEVVLSAYLLISWHANDFGKTSPNSTYPSLSQLNACNTV
jgi:SRSO17 transposase